MLKASTHLYKVLLGNPGSKPSGLGGKSNDSTENNSPLAGESTFTDCSFKGAGDIPSPLHTQARFSAKNEKRYFKKH